jgi:hypothetical protein
MAKLYHAIDESHCRAMIFCNAIRWCIAFYRDNYCGCNGIRKKFEKKIKKTWRRFCRGRWWRAPNSGGGYREVEVSKGTVMETAEFVFWLMKSFSAKFCCLFFFYEWMNESMKQSFCFFVKTCFTIYILFLVDDGLVYIGLRLVIFGVFLPFFNRLSRT